MFLTWKSSSILVTQSGIKLWKIAFLENQGDKELIDVEMQEENYYSDITTLKEPYNPKVKTTSETGNKETIIQQNTESFKTSMGKVFYAHTWFQTLALLTFPNIYHTLMPFLTVNLIIFPF